MHSGLVYTQLTDTEAFTGYRERLVAWADGPADADDRELRHASHLLHDEVRGHGMLPEHAFIALHVGGALEAITNRMPGEREALERYGRALRLLAESSLEELETPRLVHSRSLPIVWLVLCVRESRRWDTRYGAYRSDWLACVASHERRYITPVPAAWHDMSDDALLIAVAKARPDTRGPSYP
jgi:hypothetical protein